MVLYKSIEAFGDTFPHYHVIEYDRWLSLMFVWTCPAIGYTLSSKTINQKQTKKDQFQKSCKRQQLQNQRNTKAVVFWRIRLWTQQMRHHPQVLIGSECIRLLCRN